MAAIGSRALTLTIDGDEVAPEVSKCVISSAETESDFVSFADAAAGGGRTYSLDVTGVQDAAAGSLWDKVWTAAGTDVVAVVRPYGAVGAIFTGTVTITEPDGEFLGGEADASPTQRFTFECSWVYTAKPVRTVVP